MSRRLIFLTHAEVVIDPQVPVTDWGLSDKGKARHRAFAGGAEIDGVTSVYASTERKAIEGAALAADRLDLDVQQVPTLGENDRSATGYLPQEAFEAMADAFFARPDEAVRGWERARVAQTRIVSTLLTIAALDDTSGEILVVSHGGVGALLRCHLKGISITRAEDQPAGGGCWFTTDLTLTKTPGDWRRI